MTVNSHGRFSTDRAFLEVVRDYDNLTGVAKAFVARIIIEADRARAIEYYDGTEVRRLRADGEIILCGGAINSPQFLMLSGIGSTDQLRSMDIATRHDLPGVGQNLQDYLLVG